MKDPWGLSFSTGSPFWISDQAASVNFSGSPSPVTTVYSVPAATAQGGGLNPSGPLLTVGVTNIGGAAPNGENNGPTGQVSMRSGNHDREYRLQFHCRQLNWQGRLHLRQPGRLDLGVEGRADAIGGPATIPGASFTGLAIGNSSSAPKSTPPIRTAATSTSSTASGKTRALTDPNFATFPKGYAAFNVQNLGGTLYVTYANQSTGGGIVDEFSTDGKFIKTLINDTSGLWLNAPWGLALAPKSFGLFGGDLLVGNNNAGSNNLTEINAFNPSTGTFAGTLTLSNGQPFSEPDLWAISFGNGASGGSQDILYFTAGLGTQTDGLLVHCRFPSRARPSWD